MAHRTHTPHPTPTSLEVRTVVSAPRSPPSVVVRAVVAAASLVVVVRTARRAAVARGLRAGRGLAADGAP